MANTLLKFGLPLAIVAFLYQAVLRDLIFLTIGVGKTIEPISNFPYTCRRIEDPRLSACEDMFLSDATRQLFLACSEPSARPQWMPNVARFNHSGRSMNDAVIAMDIDKPIGKGSFEYRVLRTVSYPVEKHDDANLHLVGMTGNDSPNTIELLLVNNKPSRDPHTGTILDNEAQGANSTIEKFITGPAATTMKHISTHHHTRIATPNNIATAPGISGFYITNDHGLHKTGYMHTLSQVFGLGDVTYCDTSTTGETDCHKLAGGISFPNGLLYHPQHNLLYVPSSANGNIRVYRPSFTAGSSIPTLTKIHEIHIPYPIDNLSLDPHTGDIYVPCLPKALEMMAGFEDPYNAFPPSTVLRVRRTGDLDGQGQMKYEVEKVLENVGGKDTPLPGATTVVRDGKTGRLFLSVGLGDPPARDRAILV
ncbi:hypothetical protein PMZ80_008898 [Knufia obscura]|uniref:Calcium-dependent phosphotriesterase n=1 Tax=Knufia obscura TaxID=1635080 RepID=A0ABR0RDK6_9EURO|nr:hypothetical protein PMZ80_008898 [Knufia obscura]